jgi:hypothetical protein
MSWIFFHNCFDDQRQWQGVSSTTDLFPRMFHAQTAWRTLRLSMQSLVFLVLLLLMVDHLTLPVRNSISVRKRQAMLNVKALLIIVLAVGNAATALSLSQSMDVNEQHSLTAAPRTDTPRTKALQASGDVKEEPTFDAQHVARAVVHIAALPLEVTVLEMTIM